MSNKLQYYNIYKATTFTEDSQTPPSGPLISNIFPV